jgi:hypothetical protein
VNASSVLVAAAASGVLGWAGENALSKTPRHSALAPELPFLPIYAAGGALVVLAAPHLRGQPLPVRFLAYAGLLTALEAAAGAAERAAGRVSWDYGGSVVDLPHAALWGLLGLGLEAVVNEVPGHAV